MSRVGEVDHRIGVPGTVSSGVGINKQRIQDGRIGSVVIDHIAFYQIRVVAVFSQPSAGRFGHLGVGAQAGIVLTVVAESEQHFSLVRLRVVRDERTCKQVVHTTRTHINNVELIAQCLVYQHIGLRARTGYIHLAAADGNPTGGTLVLAGPGDRTVHRADGEVEREVVGVVDRVDLICLNQHRSSREERCIGVGESAQNRIAVVRTRPNSHAAVQIVHHLRVIDRCLRVVLDSRLLVVELTVEVTVVVRTTVVLADERITVLGITGVEHAGECTVVITAYNATDGVVGVDDQTCVVRIGDRTGCCQFSDQTTDNITCCSNLSHGPALVDLTCAHTCDNTDATFVLRNEVTAADTEAVNLGTLSHMTEQTDTVRGVEQTQTLDHMAFALERTLERLGSGSDRFPYMTVEVDIGLQNDGDSVEVRVLVCKPGQLVG